MIRRHLRVAIKKPLPDFYDVNAAEQNERETDRKDDPERENRIRMLVRRRENHSSDHAETVCRFSVERNFALARVAQRTGIREGLECDRRLQPRKPFMTSCTPGWPRGFGLPTAVSRTLNCVA